MSGKTKRSIYGLFCGAVYLAAFAGAVLMLLYRVPRPVGIPEHLAWVGVLACIALRIPAALHEVGHLLFGRLFGMKFAGVTLSYLRIAGGKVRFAHGDHDGETEMFPKNGRNVRAKTTAFAFGGSLLCFVVGGTLLALFLELPYHAGWLFCGLLSLFLLAEGVVALYPAELPAGKTDGAVLFGMFAKRPEEDVMLRVLTAQGILYRGSYDGIERELLFSAPVVREDLPAYHALLFLQIGYLKARGEEEEAAGIVGRLRSLGVYLTEEQRGELERLSA